MEVLDLICGHMVEVPGELPWPREMWDLRRTCKVIHSKTFDYFARTAFRAVVVRMSYSGLCKVAAISQHPQFAAKVQTILCYGHE